MRKVIYIILTMVFVATSVMAFSVSGNISSENNTKENKMEGLMEDFDDLINEVRKEKVCTADVKKCDDGSYVSRSGPNCEFTKCPEKKEANIIKKNKEEVRKNNYNTGITGGISGIKNEVKKQFRDVNPWVKIDENFWFNYKTKEWKDNQGICHTCTEENGFTKDGKIVIDGKIISRSNILEKDSNTEFNKLNNKNNISLKIRNGKFNIDSEGDRNFVWGNNKISLANGIEIESNDSSDGEDQELSLKFNGKKIKIQGDMDLKIENESVILQGKKVSIGVDIAEGKAKKAASADEVLEVKIEGEDDEVYYLIKTEKETKFLGLFNFSMESDVKIDVENGSVVEIDEPWYSFLMF